MSAGIAQRAIFVVGAKRTPFGAFGGKLKNKTANDLAEVACRAALQAASIGPENVNHIIVGNVIQSSKDAAYISRHVGLRIGLDQSVPGLTVNRMCATGFQAVVSGCYEIELGESEVVIAAGSESMTQSPFVVRNVRFGTALGAKYEFEDTLWTGLTDQLIKTPMGMTAEALGDQYKVTREDSDECALRSQTRWRLANNAGHLKAEITPMKLKGKKGEEVFDTDEHPRDTTMEILSKLKPVFRENGLITAGNASGVCDGAGALVLASEKAVKEHHLTPLARIVGWSYVGCDPKLMGIGPAPAVRLLLKKAKMELDQIDLVDVNEAFAPQVVSVQRELGLDNDKLNVSGGGIAVGHPLAASGSRISAHLVHELRRREAKYGIGTACCGGGMGMAVLFETV